MQHTSSWLKRNSMGIILRNAKLTEFSHSMIFLMTAADGVNLHLRQ